MSKQKIIEERLTTLLTPIIDNSGYELVDLALLKTPGGLTLRILLDKNGGVTLADCEKISRIVGDILDIHDPIPEHYVLEVSSPGINRPLTKEADFQRFAGQKAYIETQIPISGRKRYKGLLVGIENKTVIISVDQIDYRIPIEYIKKARLDIL